MARITTLLLSLFLFLTANARDYYFKHLGVLDGLSQVCIPSIYQDELGAVWLGTTEGLNRYNGKDVKVFRPSQTDKGLTNNEINELCGDKQGRMYIRSGNDLAELDLYTEQFTCLRENDVRGIFCKGDTLWASCDTGIYYRLPGQKELTLVTRLQQGGGGALYVDNRHIWVITQRRLYVIGRKKLTSEKLPITFNRGNCIMGDSAGNIWAGTWDGLYKITPDRQVTHYTAAQGNVSDNQVRCILEDDSRRIWIGTFRGLDCYDPATGQWEHYIRYGNSSNVLSHHSILSLHKDRQGNIWVGTYYGGVNVFDAHKGNHFYSAEPLRKDCLSFPVVGKMAEDDRGNLWICTEGGGLDCYHRETGAFTSFQHRKDAPEGIGGNNLKSIYYNKANGRLYVGTHLGGLFVWDTRLNKGHALHHAEGDSTSLPHEIVNDILPYKDGLALLTQGGPVFMNTRTETFTPLVTDTRLKQYLNREYAFETFLIDSKQRMWLASSSGGVVCVNLATSEMTRYVQDKSNPSAIGKFKVVHIFEDSAGTIYFCTIGSGVFEYQEKERSFKAYNTANGLLPSDYCYYICESVPDHCLFILHGAGISVFDEEKKTVRSTFHKFNQTYSQGSSLYLTTDNVLFVGGTNGLALIRKESLDTSGSKIRPSFDKLFVLNKEIVPNDDSGILTHILEKTSDIYLKHRQNNVTVEFATFNYSNERNDWFEYKLERFDKVWTRTPGTAITYTSLPPGDYTLRVRPFADNGGDSRPDEEIGLRIHIAAPFYATIGAYLFYLLCFATLIFVFIRFQIRQAKLKSSLEFERKEKERIEELNQVKLRFFTNISHEFRTPLTLILGQIEMLMQLNLDTAVRNRLQRIHKNAWHMRNLITELLDFRKQEQGYLKLKVEEQNLVPFTKQIYMCFYEYAQKKEITYRFYAAQENISVWFDAVQLQKVVFNILSNAFKYTPNKGSITVEIRKASSQAVISVSDSGIGIATEHLSKIFDRFYQTDHTSSAFSLGTGIGLALAKNIVTMHHGKIKVESTVGEGSKFIISLLLGNKHFKEEELAEASEQETIAMPEMDAVPLPEPETTTDLPTEGMEHAPQDEKPSLLLVDDNEELLDMLEDLFLPMYNVTLAHNGREGWDLVQRIQPDLVISDVMMPEMSGKELCYKIKTHVELSHISVILLTAQTAAEHMVEGLMFGADDYITKPFNVKVLVARCNNLIKNKKRLMAYCYGKPLEESPVADVMNEKDKELIAKCVSVIRENFDNPDFDVTALSSELCMGRSKLYARFKEITGLTPNEFILKTKLDEAMLLLKNHLELNISEISFQLGFSSPRYFSRAFKAFFGVSPQAIRVKKESKEKS